jgi:multidrug efflux system membrane fusion protein
MTKNVRYALIILVVVLVWLFSGLIINSDGTNENFSQSDQAIKLIRVKVSVIVEESFVPRLNISARTEAFRTVEIKAETSGQIEVTPIAEGEFVKAGDELARLRIDDRSFRVQEAQAGLDQATLDYQGTLTLLEKELVSEIQVARAKASVDAAKANLEFRNVELSRTRLRAPFDAVLNERKLEVGSYLQPGQTFAVLLQLDPIKAVDSCI